MASSSSWSSLKSDLEFLKQYPMLVQATSDNSTPTPGYLFGEINAVTFINNGVHCKQLVDYLLYRSRCDSPIVKIKVLKLLMHLAKNGHQRITEILKLNEQSLRELTGANGPPDPLHGRTYYENIRKMAKDLLDIVFSEEFSSFIIPQSHSFQSHSSDVPGKIGGYGSNASLKRMQGFGNTVASPKTVGERIADGLTSFVDKMISSNTEGQKIEKQSILLSESLPQYKPITVDKPYPDIQPISVKPKMTLTHSDPSLQSKLLLLGKKRVYKPGRPGGGWDDESDDGEESIQHESHDSFHSQPSNFSILSNESIDIKLEFGAVQDWLDEHKLVDDFTVNKPLSKLNWEEINATCKRCSALNCDKVIEFLLAKLSEKEENVKLRTLVCIEVLLHQDVVSVDSLSRIALPVLQSQSELDSTAVQLKSKKICMIIQKLSCYQHQNSPKHRAALSAASS